MAKSTSKLQNGATPIRIGILKDFRHISQLTREGLRIFLENNEKKLLFLSIFFREEVVY